MTVTLPTPTDCPEWCTVPEHRTAGWAPGEVRTVDAEPREANRTCARIVGVVNWPTVPNAEVDSTVQAVVVAERFQTAYDGTVEAFPPGVFLRGSDDLDDFDVPVPTDHIPPGHARRLARLLATGADMVDPLIAALPVALAEARGGECAPWCYVGQARAAGDPAFDEFHTAAECTSDPLDIIVGDNRAPFEDDGYGNRLDLPGWTQAVETVLHREDSGHTIGVIVGRVETATGASCMEGSFVHLRPEAAAALRDQLTHWLAVAAADASSPAVAALSEAVA